MKPRRRCRLLAQLAHLVGEGVEVGGVAGNGAHSHGTALTVAQQFVHKMGSVAPLVTRVAVGGEFVAGSLHLVRRDFDDGQAALGRHLRASLSSMAAWTLASQSSIHAACKEVRRRLVVSGGDSGGMHPRRRLLGRIIGIGLRQLPLGPGGGSASRGRSSRWRVSSRPARRCKTVPSATVCGFPATVRCSQQAPERGSQRMAELAPVEVEGS